MASPGRTLTTPAPHAFELALAEEISARADEYVKVVLARIETDLPAMLEQRELAQLAGEATRSLVTEFAAALRLGSDPGRLHTPAALLAYVRQLAHSGVGLATVLRSYRLGQEVVYARTAQLAEELDSPDSLRALARVGILSFRFVDGIMSEIADEFEAERELFIRGSFARRRSLLRDMLAGHPYDREEAERILGHRLAGRHLALVVWTSDGHTADDQTLANAVRPLTDALGTGRPLLVTEGRNAISVWVIPTSDGWQVPDRSAHLRELGVQVALGDAGEGPGGFIATKRQADLARSVAQLRPTQWVTWYSDVALAAVILRDPNAARSFAIEELGGLAEITPAAAALRATLSAYFRAGSDQSRAARELSMHRNTLAKHLRRAETLRGRPLTERTHELEAALTIADTLMVARSVGSK